MTGCQTTITLCYNSGAIVSPNPGGICAYLGASDCNGNITKCYNRGTLIENGSGSYGAVGIAVEMASDAEVSQSYYLSSCGATVGVAGIDSGGDLDTANAGTTSTEEDIETFDEFLEWIEEQ